MDRQDSVIDLARRLREAPGEHLSSPTGFERLVRVKWCGGCVTGVKQAAFTADWRNKHDPESFEYGWGAQSAQFVVDLVPRILLPVLRRHYKRKDVLKLIDVGAGSCVGTNVLAMLHWSHYVYSRLEIDAIDYIPLRKGAGRRAKYPLIHYTVGDARPAGQVVGPGDLQPRDRAPGRPATLHRPHSPELVLVDGLGLRLVGHGVCFARHSRESGRLLTATPCIQFLFPYQKRRAGSPPSRG
ncbi:MAG: hypothetical protein U1F20_10685 [Lysobacterales bacterium]